MTLQIKVNEFLREWAKVANVSLEFKDATMLPGTAWIAGIPIDISIYKGYLILNAIGEFGGTERSFSKSKNKGKGIFSSLYQHLPDLLKKYGLASHVYLTPLSPVWKKNYKLVETSEPVKGHWYYLDAETQASGSESKSDEPWHYFVLV
jgi:hypothetical protein